MERAYPSLSEDDYLQLDQQREERVEFLAGHVYSMSGEHPDHAAVKDAVHAALRQSRPDCLLRQAGIKVRSPGYGRRDYAYPDVLMVCEEPRWEEAAPRDGSKEYPPVLVNPTLLVEVTSPSTASRDYNLKVRAYFRLESLVEYWVVDPHEPGFVRYRRPPEAMDEEASEEGNARGGGRYLAEPLWMPDDPGERRMHEALARTRVVSRGLGLDLPLQVFYRETSWYGREASGG